MNIPFKHKIEPKELLKFLMLLGILAGYFGYLSWKYDLATGGLVSALTWSFFVLCTPVADAGFLIDFPVRLVTGMRMLITELFVWGIAITLNLTTLHFSPETYEKSFLTSMLHKILITPWPYWSIILLCAIGTFLSIHFGDKVFDVMERKKHPRRHKKQSTLKLVLMVAFALLIIWIYYDLIAALGIELPSE